MSHDPITVWKKGSAPGLDAFRVIGRCIVCDLYIADIEKLGTLEPWGWRSGNLENIDHHSPHPAFQTDVTSTELAIMRASATNVAPRGTPIIINHTDCDSILSSGIVSGRLEPLDKYRIAALAADHTGAEDIIADMLQGMDDKDLPLSATERLDLAFESLASLAAGSSVPPAAQRIVDRRRADRASAYELVQSGRFRETGRIWWAQLPAKADGELLIPFLPDAEIVVVGFPNDDVEGRWTIKARLGLAKPAGMSLQSMRINDPSFDPNWGGRWDAGSNTRVPEGIRPGTTMHVEQWVQHLADSLSIHPGQAP